MSRILLIEDDPSLRTSLLHCVASEGHDVEGVSQLSEARMRVNESWDLVLLDWMLPDGQGLDLLLEMRRNGNSTPIIFLTARIEVVDKVLGLEMGADDYLTKPFESRELLARIRVQLRKKGVHPAGQDSQKSEIQRGALKIDRIRHLVLFQEKEIPLVKKEFELLVLFAESPEKVFSREEILNKVWGYDVYPTTRTVDTHVLLLRQKICSDLIETVRAVGYRFKVLDF